MKYLIRRKKTTDKARYYTSRKIYFLTSDISTYFKLFWLKMCLAGNLIHWDIIFQNALPKSLCWYDELLRAKKLKGCHWQMSLNHFSRAQNSLDYFFFVTIMRWKKFLRVLYVSWIWDILIVKRTKNIAIYQIKYTKPKDGE